MQISSISNSPSIPVEKTDLSQVAQPAQDQAVINFSAKTFSSLVSEASQMPEVRSDVVNDFKVRIQTEHYPAQDVIAGLTRLIGGAIMQQVKSGSSS